MENAMEELKRIDHLIYVTLKYTRTVDVLISVVERMVNSYEFAIEALVKKGIEEGTIPEMPTNPIAMAQITKTTYDASIITKNLEKYLLFRRLKRFEYEKSNEFRRHVTMKVLMEDKEIIVNIDTITEDFHNLKKFLEWVDKTIK